MSSEGNDDATPPSGETPPSAESAGAAEPGKKKRGRGRPRKERTAKDDQPKRGRGRPRSKPAEDEGEKRKPGRPPGAKDKKKRKRRSPSAADTGAADADDTSAAATGGNALSSTGTRDTGTGDTAAPITTRRRSSRRSGPGTHTSSATAEMDAIAGYSPEEIAQAGASNRLPSPHSKEHYISEDFISMANPREQREGKNGGGGGSATGRRGKNAPVKVSKSIQGTWSADVRKRVAGVITSIARLIKKSSLDPKVKKQEAAKSSASRKHNVPVPTVNWLLVGVVEVCDRRDQNSSGGQPKAKGVDKVKELTRGYSEETDEHKNTTVSTKPILIHVSGGKQSEKRVTDMVSALIKEERKRKEEKKTREQYQYRAFDPVFFDGVDMSDEEIENIIQEQIHRKHGDDSGSNGPGNFDSTLSDVLGTTSSTAGRASM